MNKRAQFFIIAALILAGIILIFGKTYTSSKTAQDNLKVYDLSNQIQYEASQVIDNGVYNDRPLSETTEALKNLSELYSKLNPDSDIYIMFGNSSELHLIEYNSTSRKVEETALSLSQAAAGSMGIAAANNPSGNRNNANNNVNFEILPNQKARIRIKTHGAGAGDSQREVSHDVDISQKQSFYVILRKSINDQDVVVYR